MSNLSDDDAKAIERAKASPVETSPSLFDQVSMSSSVLYAIAGAIQLFISFNARNWFPVLFKATSTPGLPSQPVGFIEVFGAVIANMFVFALGWPLILTGSIGILAAGLSLFIIGYRVLSGKEDWAL